MQTYQLTLVLGKNYLLSFHRKNLSSAKKLRENVARDPERYLGRGVDYLGYYFLDSLVDDYFPVLDRLEDEIDQVEDEVLLNPTRSYWPKSPTFGPT